MYKSLLLGQKSTLHHKHQDRKEKGGYIMGMVGYIEGEGQNLKFF